MSSPSLKKIAKSLKRLARQQEELCRRLDALDGGRPTETTEAPETSEPCEPASSEETLSFLDQFRAAEALGDASLGAWIAVCQSESLRGGLRTVQLREASHARLLEERLKELGGSPTFELPQALEQATLESVAATHKSDAEKVQEFVARFPDCEAALAPILSLADRLDHDPQTQSLLRTIAQDEGATLEFFHRACEQLAAS